MSQNVFVYKYQIAQPSLKLIEKINVQFLVFLGIVEIL